MKQQLLKKLSFVFAFFAITSVSAQTWTFDSDLEGYTQNFGTNGTVEWDADGGAGALKLTRTTNNANFGPSIPDNGGGIDADANKIIKIVIKNLTAAVDVRVGATGEDATSGNKNFNGILTAESGTYETYFLDMDGEAMWNGTLSNLWIAIRGNVGTDSDAAYIDSIELLPESPSVSIVGILQNPSFDDLGGSVEPFNPATKPYATVTISSEETRTGPASLKHEYTATPDNTHFVFNNYIHDLGATTTDDITASIWVKVVRPSTPGVSPLITVQGQGRTGTTLVVTELNNMAQNKTTTMTDGSWEEVTYTYSPADPYSTAQFRYGILMTNLEAGDIVYIDDLSAETTEPLSITKNTLENVSLYPNPASGYVNINNLNDANIKIYNVLGEVVKSEKALSNEHAINISNLSSGIYLVKLTSEGQTATKKLIIK